MSFGRLLLGMVGAALLAQGLTFALHFGWAPALGLLILALGLGHLLAPGLRAHEGRRMYAFLLNLAAVLWGWVADNRAADTMSLITTAVILMLLWDEEGPHLGRRWHGRWQKVTRRLSRPVITLPS